MKFVIYARPHLLSSPPGEEMAAGRFWFGGWLSGQSCRWFFQQRGERVSLSANGVGGEGWGEVARKTFFTECGRPRPQQRPNCDALLPVRRRPCCHIAAPGRAPAAGGKLPRRAMKTAAAKIVFGSSVFHQIRHEQAFVHPNQTFFIEQPIRPGRRRPRPRLLM